MPGRQGRARPREPAAKCCLALLRHLVTAAADCPDSHCAAGAPEPPPREAMSDSAFAPAHDNPERTPCFAMLQGSEPQRDRQTRDLRTSAATSQADRETRLGILRPFDASLLAHLTVCCTFSFCITLETALLAVSVT